MKISDDIGRSWIILTGFTSHQLFFLKPLFHLSTQGRRITMLELMSLVNARLHNPLNNIVAVNFCNRQPNNKLEDSFVHNVISVIFDSVFQSESLLSYQWANGYLNKSSQYKPDFIVFVQHSRDRYDIAVSEVKPPHNSNNNSTGESDLVKIGKEMMWMVNTLIKQGVEEPVVCGVLLKGLKMTTFKMDLKYPQTYRLIELSSVNLFEGLQGVGILPTILRNILQIKNIVKKTAIKAKKCALAKSSGNAVVNSPPLTYTVNSTYNLRRKQKKKTAQKK